MVTQVRIQPKPTMVDITVNAKPKAKRAFKPKVRTGCYTCKVRRVKCDETKPACLRCTKTGRHCDGYVSPGTITLEVKEAKGASPELSERGALVPPSSIPDLLQSLTQIVMPSLSSDIFDSSVGARNFQFFQEVTSPALGAFTAPYIWDTVVPQYCHNEPAILHLVHAVAISHEATHDNVFKCDDSSPKWLHDPRRRVFTDHYTKAMGRLARQSTNPISVEIILLACLLFISVENFQNKNQVACGHIRSGVKVGHLCLESLLSFRCTEWIRSHHADPALFYRS